MKDERMKVLEMLAAGKINAEEAYRLLAALEGASEGGAGESWDQFAREFADFGSQFRDWGRDFGASFKDLGEQFRGWGGDFNRGFKEGQGGSRRASRGPWGPRRSCRDE